jgi:serine protease AprX
MSRLSLLILVLSAAFLVQTGSEARADSTGVYWIFLRDKGPDSESRLAEFQKQLPSRTIQRRRKSIGTEIVTDIYDLPVYRPYVDSLAAMIIALREQSRWLNAVSAEIELADLETIANLTFVTEIRPVLSSDPKSIKVGVTDSWTAGERDYPYRPTSIDYGRSFDQLEQINVIRAHEQGYHGEGIIICFLDTGFLTYHHAFNHMNILAAYDFINDDEFVGFDPDQDLPGQPDHGTGCLGTIGGYYPGELVGPAFEASYILCKTEETGSETAVEEDYYVAGLEWGERMGADVASSSLSYSDWYTSDDYDGQSCVTTIAANIAFQKGMILCSSMGNEGPGRFTLGAPADSRYSLGIGAVRWNAELAGFSSWGPTVDGRIKPDICARGVATVAATPYTTDGFGLWNGTSLSCPLAAGVVALVIQAHPNWSPMLVKEAILETSSRSNRPDIRYGWGIANAMEAINYPSYCGYVVDRHSKRGMVVKIVLEMKESGEIVTVRSDNSGWFLFANLVDGSYEVTIEEKGYLPYITSIEIPPSQEFDIVLQEIGRNR